MPKRTRTGTCGEARGRGHGRYAKSRCPRAMHMRDDSCHAGVARATDHNQSIEGTYLPCAGQRGRAVLCKPADRAMRPCHSGTRENTMLYTQCMLLNLTACIHSPYSYMICVSEAKMAARSPPTPSPCVTATGVDSAGPIGRAHKGIDFCPRMRDGWAYLEVYTPRLQSSEKDLLGSGAPVTVRISMVSIKLRRSDVKLRCHFRTLIFLVWQGYPVTQHKGHFRGAGAHVNAKQ